MYYLRFDYQGVVLEAHATRKPTGLMLLVKLKLSAFVLLALV
jgi:hypothetical protein